MEAARSQLRTAIELWFDDGDAVSIHTLAFAAYQVIHTVSKQRNPGRRDLLFDSLVIKEEYSRQFNDLIKQYANFFKHADRDGEAEIEFKPILSELFILFAIFGVELCKEQLNEAESGFSLWLQIHRPQLLTERGREMVENRISVEALNQIRNVSKNDFFKVFKIIRAREAAKLGRPKIRPC